MSKVAIKHRQKTVKAVNFSQTEHHKNTTIADCLCSHDKVTNFTFYITTMSQIIVNDMTKIREIIPTAQCQAHKSQQK